MASRPAPHLLALIVKMNPEGGVLPLEAVDAFREDIQVILCEEAHTPLVICTPLAQKLYLPSSQALWLEISQAQEHEWTPVQVWGWDGGRREGGRGECVCVCETERDTCMTFIWRLSLSLSLCMQFTYHGNDGSLV